MFSGAHPVFVIPSSFGPKLSALISSSGVTDVLINGHREVWLQRGAGPLEAFASPFESEDELAELAQSLIAEGGRHVDQANPFGDVSIGGKFRVHAALASVCHPRTLVSVRVHHERHFGLAQLFELGMFGELEFETLKGMVVRRENFLVAGAAGAGKTTLLRALLAECRGERVIALEDVAEIGLESGHFISLQTRQANIEGRGEIGLARLVREALRMRPDRIAIGEVRGDELMVMLQALNTGHSGGGATIHANSFAGVEERIAAIGRSAGFEPGQIVAEAKSAIDWVIFLSRKSGRPTIETLGRFK